MTSFQIMKTLRLHGSIHLSRNTHQNVLEKENQDPNSFHITLKKKSKHYKWVLKTFTIIFTALKICAKMLELNSLIIEGLMFIRLHKFPH